MQDAGLEINADKPKSCTLETEYLGYVLTGDGMKPQANKVQVILALNPPTNIKELQYYCDLWAKSSKMLASLTNLVGEVVRPKSQKQRNQKGTLALG